MKKCFVAFLFLCVWNLFSVGAQVPVVALDALLNAHFSPDRPGGAVLVAQRGQVVYRKAFGLADVPNHIPMDVGNIFRIGSLTKQFTAAAILQLAEQGRLSVKDTIGKYLVGYPTQGKTIRIEHLLTHTSGIKSYTGMDRWDAAFRKKDLTVQELVDFFKNEPMDFAPDVEWRYNNSGYVLLGYIIEQVTGKPYETYLQERILRPLGMKHTYFGMAEDTLRHRALGYEESEADSTVILSAEPLSMTQPYAAGAMLSTVDDLYTWTKALHSGQVVSAKDLKHMLYPYYLPSGKSTHYAYGLKPGLLFDSFTSEHGGGINGFTSYMLYLINEETCVVVLTNCGCERPAKLAERIAALVTGKDIAPKSLDWSEEKLREYTGVYEQERTTQCYIVFEDGKLYYKQPGSEHYVLLPFAPDEFYVPGTLIRLKFMRAEKDGGSLKSMIVSDRSEEYTLWERTEKPLPKERAIVEVEALKLERYVGKYQLMPEFFLHITRQDNQLFVQGTGQPRLALFAISPTRFFLKEVDAEIEFETGEGPSPKLTLFQSGQKLIGERKE